MLHLIQKSPFQSSCLNECLNIAQPDDQFILMLDGVYALQNKAFINRFNEIYILQDDLAARGLSLNEENSANVTLIDYKKMVELTVTTNKSLSWF